MKRVLHVSILCLAVITLRAQTEKDLELTAFLSSNKDGILLKTIDSLQEELNTCESRRKHSQDVNIASEALIVLYQLKSIKGYDTVAIRKRFTNNNFDFRIDVNGMITLFLKQEICNYLVSALKIKNIYSISAELSLLYQRGQFYINEVTPQCPPVSGQAPVIEMPAFSSGTLSKPPSMQYQATHYMNYILSVFKRYPFPAYLLTQLKTEERKQAPANNAATLVSLRLKFILYLKENASWILHKAGYPIY